MAGLMSAAGPARAEICATAKQRVVHHRGVIVRPLPGIDRQRLFEVLRAQALAAENLRGSGGGRSHYERLSNYLEWATEAASQLGSVVSTQDVDRLVWTPGYVRLIGSATVADNPGGERLVNLMVSRELDERIRVLAETGKAVNAVITGLSHGRALFVPDTGFFVEVPNSILERNFDLRAVNFAELFDCRGPIHLVIPIVVIDQLDGLKQRGESHIRWRAGHSLGVFDEIFRLGAPAIGLLREASPVRTGPVQPDEVTAEIVLDPPGHTRLPITDDEIVDRAVAVQAFAGRPVTLVTYDTGHSTRAHQAGLRGVHSRVGVDLLV